jgi:hypothetical protein
MGQGGRTGERLEMVPAKAGNYILVVVVVVVVVVVDEIDSQVVRIECLCLVYFQHYYLMLPHCPLGIVVSPAANPLEPYWLSSGGIRSSTCDVNK